VSGVVAFSQEFVRAVSQSSQVMIDRRHWYYSAYFRSVMVAIVSISVADVVVFPWNFSFIYEKLCKVFQVDQQTLLKCVYRLKDGGWGMVISRSWRV
jgi:hypothetical protein